MTVLDIDQVPGLPAARLAALRAVGVHLTSDLLRSNRDRLARAVAVSVDDIRVWQSFCTLLEIEGLTPDAVVALLAAGIDRLDEFCGKGLTALRPVLQAGAVAMTDDEIVASLMAARKLQYCGVLNGTVMTSGGQPLVGAVARAGGQTAQTDARGRFRIIGLRLETKYSVSIEHPTRRGRIFSRVSAHPSSALIGRKFVLTGSPAPLSRLSALRGDVLPPIGSAPIATEMRNEPLASEDRFVLFEFYSNGDGKLASLFMDFDQGRFVQRSYRVAKAELPAGCKLRDRMLLEGGRLKVAKITSGRIGRLTRIRAVQARFSGRVLTSAEREQKLRLLLKAMSDPD